MQSTEKEKEINDKDKDKDKNINNSKKKPFIIIDKQNNIKHFHIKRKSLSKKNEEHKNKLIFNYSKKSSDNKKLIKDNKNFLTNENTTNNIYNKIPKSKLSIYFGCTKKHLKMKPTLNVKKYLIKKGYHFLMTY